MVIMQTFKNTFLLDSNNCVRKPVCGHKQFVPDIQTAQSDIVRYISDSKSSGYFLKHIPL